MILINPGATVTIQRADGSQVTYSVTKTPLAQEYPSWEPISIDHDNILTLRSDGHVGWTLWVNLLDVRLNDKDYARIVNWDSRTHCPNCPNCYNELIPASLKHDMCQYCGLVL